MRADQNHTASRVSACLVIALLLGSACSAPAQAGWKFWQRGDGGNAAPPPALGALPTQEKGGKAPSAFRNMTIETNLGGAPDKPGAEDAARGGGILPGATKVQLKRAPQSLEHLYAGDKLVETTPKPSLWKRMKPPMPKLGIPKFGKGAQLGSSKPMSLQQLSGNSLGVPNITRITPQDASMMKNTNPFETAKVDGLIGSPQTGAVQQQAPKRKAPRIIPWQSKDQNLGFNMGTPGRFTPRAIGSKMKGAVSGNPVTKARLKWKVWRSQRQIAGTNQKHLKKFGLSY